MRGPKLERLAEYGAGLSLLNPTSLLNTIRNTKSIGISTGAVKETQAYFGVFGNVRANGVGNLSTTLEGQVNTRLSLYCHLDFCFDHPYIIYISPNPDNREI